MKLFGRKKTPVDLLVNQLSEEEKAFLLSHKELDRGVDDSLFTDEEKKMLDLTFPNRLAIYLSTSARHSWQPRP